MKNKKLILWIGAAILLVVLTVVALKIFGKSGKKELSDPQKFEPYITGYTKGIISKNSDIVVQFTDKFIQEIKDKKITEDIFEFSPDIKGKTSWVDEHTVAFTPAAPLKSGQEFFVTVNLKTLNKEIPKEFKEFIFKTKVKNQNFDVSISELITTDLNDFSKQDVIGTIRLADVESEDKVKSLISASVGGKKQTISFEKIDDLRFSYRVTGITRTNAAQELIISYDGKPIEVNKNGVVKYPLPALDNFSIIEVKINNFPEQSVVIQFSDPIMSEQLLDGLITIGDEASGDFIIRNNIIKFIPAERIEGEYELVVSEGVKNIKGKEFEATYSKTLNFESLKPQVRLVSSGVVLPTIDAGLVFPFEAVNLKAVDVRITRIFENNILQFLQVNNLDGDSELERVGKVVKETTVDLSASGVTDFGEWNRFTLDLNDLIKTEPGAIYRIEIGFRKKHSAYPCSDTISENPATSEVYDNDSTFWDYFENYTYDEYDYYYYDYYYDDYDKPSPCKNSYYGYKNVVSRNIMASDIGLTAKLGKNNQVVAITTNLLTAKPMSGIEIKVYTFQMQVIATGKTNEDGVSTISIPAKEKPYFVVASDGKQKAYVALNYGSSLSLSEFNVSGASSGNSKGFIFGERGVWRPGDSIYLSFILQDKDIPIPEGHPIVLEVTNPSGQLIYREVQNKNTWGYHTFKFKTDQKSVTGNYAAKISVGSDVYYKTLPVETIKPNRLKINLDFDKSYISGDGEVNATLTTQWLHGAVGKDLKAQININLDNAYTGFDKFEGYTFSDFTKRFQFTTQLLFDGVTDENGKVVQPVKLDIGNQAPGVLTAYLTAKVFEKGGNFSIFEKSIVYHPYSNYIGIKPDLKNSSNYVKPGSKNKMSVVIVDRNGKAITGSKELELEVFKYDYSWWYDYENTQTNFASANYNNALSREKVTISNGKGSIQFEAPDVNYGSFIVIVSDKKGGHSASTTIYVSSYDYYYDDGENHQNVNQIMLTANKDTFAVGEDIRINIPSVDGNALISIENGSRVLKTFWQETHRGTTEVVFKATREMSPNIFINISLFQPHSSTGNDHPIRMYGLIPVMVEDPETHLHPVITMPNELRSESTYTVKISEKDGKAMSYTIAVVDEGILNLTGFKTPDPWSHFYSREALGVNTWDMYDYVIGAFGVEIERLLSIGGDAGLKERLGDLKANRFEPMVRFIGPFHLEKGKTASHTIAAPAYVGSVRTMVVARENAAYGSAEKTTPVTKPLMLLGTLPRVLGPQEEVFLPISIFSMDSNIKQASVQVKTNDLVMIDGSTSQTVNFPQKGEQFIQFKLKAGNKTGVAKIMVTAQSGTNIATQQIEVDIRYPITTQTDVKSGIADAGKSIEESFSATGIQGTNKLCVEVYSIPPLNLEKRLNYLIQYPYGCIEQTVSAAFPQLYLSYLINLDAKQKEKIQQYINQALNSLALYQSGSGGFNYWPSAYSEVSSWGTSYAGQFMLEAEALGYQVPSQVKKKWLSYQKAKASGWVDEGYSSQLDQAYRLYTLALAGNPDKGAMNRLLQNKNLRKESKWRLAAAYQLCGKKDVALQLIKGADTNVSDYYEMGGNFGSALRDKAMILETLVLLGEKQKAFELLLDISEQISKDTWYSTQTTAYSLLAMSKYVAYVKPTGKIACKIAFNGKSTPVNCDKPVYKMQLPIHETAANSFSLKNNGSSMVYYRLVFEGIPQYGNETAANSKINMKIDYTTLDGTPLDPAKIIQGTDFIATVQIQPEGNPTKYENLALSQLFPSGWEIINSRMFDTDLGSQSYASYQDIRDDRIYTYFDINYRSVKTFKVMLNASYAGKFYMPPVQVAAMYDNTIYARTKGQWIEIETSY
ncbi:MAG TPA: MG2 domain-containing protein [Bacteroidales bacterium]|nr:MG2 domain-containing protein [Bacteroidales bacterium]